MPSISIRLVHSHYDIYNQNRGRMSLTLSVSIYLYFAVLVNPHNIRYIAEVAVDTHGKKNGKQKNGQPPSAPPYEEDREY
jgi:hypothetical protein